MQAVLAELQRGGMSGYDISDDELAKSHARHMIGGASDVPNERIFRFGARSSSPPLPLPRVLRHHRVSHRIPHPENQADVPNFFFLSFP